MGCIYRILNKVNGKSYIGQTVYDKLVAANRHLPNGYHFCLYEGYRSLALQKLIFEPNDGELEEKISNAIESAISQWLPQLTVEKIDIDATADIKDKNQVDISIIFTAKYNQQNFSVKFKINE